MKDNLKFHASKEKKDFDFANPDMEQVTQIFSDMFGGPFAVEKQDIPENCVRCPGCEGTGRVIQVKKHLLGTSKNVTKDPCPRCEGMGYVPKE